ncbi:dimethylargininase [Marinitenerispora sediminis]|uniref:Amidinotransferase n=1 Tax=Marinitenerispora sediminis TaxID=1931232 RepID=A0A368TA96_9ACTN|nr:dimethylargininase [Marinitenerispora sediminis]RCV52982.1 amidinotransferase [Marinitenerispora sediminis]RCV58452.1 amidinotransferase [Marinitenerispora sediminis]RCV61822.1 amidinotransferase [Marinitenerispora sediminis]
MCPPTHFTVSYTINAWMDPAAPVDRDRAVAQWERLRAVYLELGHRVSLLDPVPGLPDMVFTANGALVIGGTAYGARFRHPQRSPEEAAHREWLTAHGGRFAAPEHVNEGEGDFAVTRDCVLAGTGFRTEQAAHLEAQEVFGLPVVSLRLVDPRFYHLDTALTVLDDGVHSGRADIAYYPGAFSGAARQVLGRLFPDALRVAEADAAVLGLNAVSDGRNVVLPEQARGLAARLAERGYRPIGVDMSELAKSGGGPKCCTQEIRA